MKFLEYFKNLFTGFRPYNFVSKRLWAQPQKEKSFVSHSKPKHRYTKHRYTHTTKKWNIGNK